jgi:inosine/xanthosine triphosphate pyrophosphatase family protein
MDIYPFHPAEKGKGAGYVFIPEGYSMTYVQMPPRQEQRASRHPRVIQKMMGVCLIHYG